MPHSVGSLTAWLVFAVIVVGMLALDLGVFHRDSHAVSVKEAAIWSAVWVGISLLFAAGIAWRAGATRATEFLTGYVIEKALAVDNIFVIAALFSYFETPPRYQHRVLYWGIIGAALMRALFVGAGAALIARFHFILYVFGVLLIVAGARLLWQKEDSQAPHGQRRLVRLVRRLLPMTSGLRGSAFWVDGQEGVKATPLVLTLVCIEITDVAFAIDSIPAVFAVTTDPFIVLTSNLFAVLGLRSMYFLLANAIERLRYLKLGLALILAFVGVRLLLADWVEIPVLVSLGVIGALLFGAVAFSWLRARRGAAGGAQKRADR